MWRDTQTRFGLVSVLLHWINAAFVIALIVIGLMVWPLPRGPGRSGLLHLHVSLAMTAMPFVVARVIWRLRHGKPRTVEQPKALKLLAEAVWRVLMACLVLQMISGPLLVWLHGRPIEIFGLVSLPTPFAANDGLHEALIKPLHQAVAVILIGVLGLHLLGALKHLLWDRDGVVTRMVWPFADRPAGVEGPRVNEAVPGDMGLGTGHPPAQPE
jgi:cytochrome b561